MSFYAQLSLLNGLSGNTTTYPAKNRLLIRKL